MKRYKSTITALLVACTCLFAAACSNEYMEDLNTDPSKAATIDPNAQLTTAELQTYGSLDMVDAYKRISLCIYAAIHGMLEHHQLRWTSYGRQQ